MARVSALHLDHVVTFLGAKNINEIGELFIDSTALLLPSHSEPWGLVVNESLAMAARSLSATCRLRAGSGEGRHYRLLVRGRKHRGAGASDVIGDKNGGGQSGRRQTVSRSNFGLHAEPRCVADSRRMRTDRQRPHMTKQLAFVAPLPPPVHGFSNICAAMLELLKSRASVGVFNRRRDTAGSRRGFACWSISLPMAYGVRDTGTRIFISGCPAGWVSCSIGRIYHRQGISSQDFCSSP